MLPSFATATIVRQRATLADDGHGNQVPDWTSPAELPIAGCSVQPGATVEDRQNRDSVLIAFTVYVPAGSDVLATDRIRIGSAVFEIDGEPERWETGLSVDHVKLFLRRWEG